MALSYADALSALTTHATAAAAALDDPILDVAVGAPVPEGRCVRLYYDGETQPARMPGQRTLNAEMVAERISLILFIPVTEMSLSQMQAVEAELYDFKHELRTRVLGDSQLGGQSTDLEMEYAEPDFVVIGNIRYRILGVSFVTDFAEYSIAP